MITWDDFKKVEMRVGTIIQVEDSPQARNPSYKLLIDFGESGIKRSSAQITELYKKEVLLNSQVIAVTNLPPETNSPDQIGVSECLVLGVVVDNKEVVLLKPEREVANGTGIA